MKSQTRSTRHSTRRSTLATKAPRRPRKDTLIKEKIATIDGHEFREWVSDAWDASEASIIRLRQQQKDLLPLCLMDINENPGSPVLIKFALVSIRLLQEQAFLARLEPCHTALILNPGSNSSHWNPNDVVLLVDDFKAGRSKGMVDLVAVFCPNDPLGMHWIASV